MNIEELRIFALQLNDVTEGFPFGDDTLVYKVNNKIFLLVGLNAAVPSMNVKCDPEKALELREEFPGQVLPGFHMNKKHWNTIVFQGLKTSFLKQMIEDSYHLVAGKKK
ncbi:MAG: MmcQ/YjbR family DNA-binding protein [Gloeobacteraceae cyanobacterium ES-bin-316]|nr:MmcQ/YjbR family DNA-binding protein [Ferruginibacter sp.]